MRHDAKQDSQVTVTLPAEIDGTNAAQIADEICAVLTPGVDVVVADLTSTVFCDSSCVRHLLLAHDRITASGGQMRFAAAPGGPVQQILELTGFSYLIAVYPTLEEAQAGGPPPPSDNGAGKPPASAVPPEPTISPAGRHRRSRRGGGRPS